ncbi:hypothetical protein [Deinococcus kurensis]|uniref:hypothetical protein n=1 Tax=Deinococcus kurensis TaxID=2662757 RepID=UPI0012D302A6|nr:hypothetical protein [Deinococcus kurensis]
MTDLTLPADPDAWMGWIADTPVELWSPHTVAVLRHYAPAYARAERLTAQYDLHAYHTAAHLPPRNPFQVSEVLLGYRRWKQGGWPAPTGGRSSSGGSVIRFSTQSSGGGLSFWDLMSEDRFTDALDAADPISKQTLADLRWKAAVRADRRTVDYEHPDMPALKAALEDLRERLWDVCRLRGFAYRTDPQGD